MQSGSKIMAACIGAAVLGGVSAAVVSQLEWEQSRSDGAPDTPPPGQVPSSAPILSPQYFSTSSVRGIRVAVTQDLPSPPSAMSVDEYCNGYVNEPTTDFARQVATRGWHVTSEGRVGALQATAFVRGFEPGTSGVCFPVDGNVALSDGDRLVAIIYGGEAAAIGDIHDAGDFNSVRITDGTGVAAPLGDVRVQNGSIVVQPLPAADRVCGGDFRVPNVFSIPIERAALQLQASGWTPVGPNYGLQSCAGTGYAQCLYNFDQGQRSLEVITVGEDGGPVVNYSIEC